MSDSKDKDKFEATWKKQTTFGPMQNLVPIINNLILLIEEEKKRTEAQVEQISKLLEKVQNNR